MKSVGHILKKQREKQGKSLSQINRITKIPEKNLLALEADNYSLLPAPTFVKGFIQIYAKALDLDPEKLVAIFRRDSQKKEQSEVLPQGLTPITKKTFWNPKLTISLAIGLLLAVFLSFFGFHLKNYFSPPILLVEKPVDNQEIKEEQVEVKGKTSKDVSVYVNDELINVDAKGEFNYQFKVFSGTNTITVKAVNSRDKETTISRQIKVLNP